LFQEEVDDLGSHGSSRRFDLLFGRTRKKPNEFRNQVEEIVSSPDFAGFDSKEKPMNEALVIGLLMVATFSSLWGMFYARRSYQNTKKIMDKVGH